jgi:hypothetical protein
VHTLQSMDFPNRFFNAVAWICKEIGNLLLHCASELSLHFLSRLNINQLTFITHYLATCEFFYGSVTGDPGYAFPARMVLLEHVDE